MTESLLRQRRNVIISSVILLALCLGEVQIAQLSFAGMTFGAFKKPEIFLLGVWIAFLYFVYRYFVFFVEDGIVEINKTWWRELERAANPRIEAIVRKQYPQPNEACLFSYTSVRRYHYTWKGQAYLDMEENAVGGLGRLKDIKDVEVQTPKSQLFLWELKGCLRFIILTPALTEYVLPFVLAVGTFVFCGFLSAWAGSFHVLLA